MTEGLVVDEVFPVQFTWGHEGQDTYVLIIRTKEGPLRVVITERKKKKKKNYGVNKPVSR